MHNFHIYRYLWDSRVHVRIVQTRWEGVGRILPYIYRGPWVERKGKKERAIRVTFDELLRPAVTAWNKGEPYAQLVCSLPNSEANLITTTVIVPDGIQV